MDSKLVEAILSSQKRFSSFGCLGLNVLTLDSSLVTALSNFPSEDPNSPQTLLSELQTLTQLPKFLSKARCFKSNCPGPWTLRTQVFLWV